MTLRKKMTASRGSYQNNRKHAVTLPDHTQLVEFQYTTNRSTLMAIQLRGFIRSHPFMVWYHPSAAIYCTV